MIAAAQAGIKRVLLPARNKSGFDDIPEEVRKQLEFIWIERIEEVMSAALDPKEQDSPLPRQAAV